ncbi:MAG: hypothetical protein GXP39_06730 [Chloroflexi bacterium]|nr:hypothetical protein [Chloroflexota bacterium]
MTDQEREGRPRIYTEITRSAILHVEDALDIGKLRLLLFQYERGKGAQARVDHYLDVEDARVLCFDLARGHLPESFVDYKGTPHGREGKPLSRVLRIEDRGRRTRQPIVIEISHGPGEIIGEGAVKPAGEPDVRIAILLTRWQARRLALAVAGYIQAWEVAARLQGRPATSRVAEEPDVPYQAEELPPDADIWL